MAIVLYGIVFPILIGYHILVVIGVFGWAVLATVIDLVYPEKEVAA